MTPEVKQELDRLKREIAELKRWKEDRQRQQLALPLDTASVNVLKQALYSTELERIYIRDLFFRTGNEINPTVSGQMNYYDGASKGIRIYVNGFTGQLDATAV